MSFSSQFVYFLFIEINVIQGFESLVLCIWEWNLKVKLIDNILLRKSYQARCKAGYKAFKVLSVMTKKHIVDFFSAF